MREEKVTINIMEWLEKNKWKIICYDFPQSGTGILLHINDQFRNGKSKDGIIPDIIAVKNNIALYFENKDKFYEPDFEKIYKIKTELKYSESINELLKNYNIKHIYYGIGFPYIRKEIEKSKSLFDKIDFLICVSNKKEVFVKYDNTKLLIVSQ